MVLKHSFVKPIDNICKCINNDKIKKNIYVLKFNYALK